MNLVDYLGYAAALCTTGAYVPQVLRVWRTRSTEDISLRAFLVLVTGLALWFGYGLWKGDFPMIASNGVTLALASVILYFKLKQVRGKASPSRVQDPNDRTQTRRERASSRSPLEST